MVGQEKKNGVVQESPDFSVQVSHCVLYTFLQVGKKKCFINEI